MKNSSQDTSPPGNDLVDKGLIFYFLNLSPEERLLSNDNAIQTILELRNEFKQQPVDRRESERITHALQRKHAR